ncbi:MAG: NFACT family protein [Thermoplasmata archaeon]|nr:NFACT family protein [Candidatus Sysuiplasma acidicola]MBX8646045.1 NFACT family protein [Candidatus Sysuiplasma acidicola]
MRNKNSMTSLDVLLLQRELSTLIGAYAEKAFGGKPFSIRFNAPSMKRELVLADGLFLFLTERLEKQDGAEVGEFSATIRRKFDNSRVTDVKQEGFDRLIRMSFSRPENAEIVFELMGRGNVLVVESGKITAAMKYERRGSAEIKQGNEYVRPGLRFDARAAQFGAFREALLSSRADIVRSLATVLGLGPDFAEEICSRTGIVKETRPSELTEEQMKKLKETTDGIILETIEKPHPVVYYSDGYAVQFTPVPFAIFSGLERRECRSISDAILQYISNRRTEQKDDAAEKHEKLLERQREAIRNLTEEGKKARNFADSIYADYAQFGKLISAFRKGNDAPYTYTRKAGNVISVNAGGCTLEIDTSKDIDTIASSIYDQAKEIDRKLRRAEKALAEMESSRPSSLKPKQALHMRKASKRFWFDTYRWFISSEGCLVIAGRDAKTNDRLVSRHLAQTDRYAHADVYGAPSTVVKWKEGVTEATLEEACGFALCFSRAWNAQIGAASAYWVTPDQVSKTPQTGEFLPRGAFVIRGKRNYFNRLKLELALGVIEYEGERRIACAPVSAIRANSDRYVVLTPGSMTKEKIAAALHAEFETTSDEIVSVLPPGKSSFTPMAKEVPAAANTKE